jgi:hypothetical protein
VIRAAAVPIKGLRQNTIEQWINANTLDIIRKKDGEARTSYWQGKNRCRFSSSCREKRKCRRFKGRSLRYTLPADCHPEPAQQRATNLERSQESSREPRVDAADLPAAFKAHNSWPWCSRGARLMLWLRAR